MQVKSMPCLLLNKCSQCGASFWHIRPVDVIGDLPLTENCTNCKQSHYVRILVRSPWWFLISLRKPAVFRFPVCLHVYQDWCGIVAKHFGDHDLVQPYLPISDYPKEPDIDDMLGFAVHLLSYIRGMRFYESSSRMDRACQRLTFEYHLRALVGDELAGTHQRLQDHYGGAAVSVLDDSSIAITVDSLTDYVIESLCKRDDLCGSDGGYDDKILRIQLADLAGSITIGIVGCSAYWSFMTTGGLSREWDHQEHWRSVEFLTEACGSSRSTARRLDSLLDRYLFPIGIISQ